MKAAEAIRQNTRAKCKPTGITDPSMASPAKGGKTYTSSAKEPADSERSKERGRDEASSDQGTGEGGIAPLVIAPFVLPGGVTVE